MPLLYIIYVVQIILLFNKQCGFQVLMKWGIFISEINS